MQNPTDTKSPLGQTPSLVKRLGQIGMMVLTATLLAGCYIGPADGYGGGGWHHHGYR